MSWKWVYSLIPIAFCSSAHALVEEPLNEKKSLPIIFSTTSHNRISIERGSVEKVFADEAYFNIMLDPATGNAFVTVIKPILEPIAN